MVIVHFNGTLMYVKFCGDKGVERRYTEVVMSLSVKEFHTYAVYIGNEEKDRIGRLHHVWSSPAWLIPRW